MLNRREFIASFAGFAFVTRDPSPGILLYDRHTKISRSVIAHALHSALQYFSSAGIFLSGSLSDSFPALDDLEAFLFIIDDEHAPGMRPRFGVENERYLAGGPMRSGSHVSRNDYAFLRSFAGMPYDEVVSLGHVGLVPVPMALHDCAPHTQQHYLSLHIAHEAAHCFGAANSGVKNSIMGYIPFPLLSHEYLFDEDNVTRMRVFVDEVKSRNLDLRQTIALRERFVHPFFRVEDYLVTR